MTDEEFTDGFLIELERGLEEQEEPVLTLELSVVVEKVRTIVRLFKKSPVKNDEKLMKYVTAELGKELMLILDCKTRWNSLLQMLRRFLKLKGCVAKALVDLQMEKLMPEYYEIQVLEELVDALLPVQYAVEELCRRDATLVTADGTFAVLLDALHDVVEKHGSYGIAEKLRVSLLKRIRERRGKLSGLAQYLNSATQDPNVAKYFSPLEDEEIKKLLHTFVKKFKLHGQSTAVQIEEPIGSTEVEETAVEEAVSDEDALKARFKASRLQAQAQSKTRVNTKTSDTIAAMIQKEMTLWEVDNVRGPILEKVLEFLLTIPPTSVESERVFSAVTVFLTYLRCRLSDDSVDNISFLRIFFKALMTIGAREEDD